MLELRNISSGYGKRQVLFDVSLSISKGDIALLIGSNGSGKTTLLRTIMGLIKPFAGSGNNSPSIVFAGKQLIGKQPYTMIDAGLVFVPQRNNYFENIDVKGNLMVSASAIHDKGIVHNKGIVKERLEEIYQLLPVVFRNRHRLPGKLSGGERQMVVLAMAFLHRPGLLLIDEPTLNLSPAMAATIFRKIKEFNRLHGTTVLLIEHKIRESMEIADRLIGMKDGRLHGNYGATAAGYADIIIKLHT